MTDLANAEPIPAAAADFLTPELPRPTDGVAPPPPESASSASEAPPEVEVSAAAPAPSTPPALDRAGQPWDPAKHAPGPGGRGELTARGTWRKLGQRGRPFTKKNPAADPAPPAPDDDGQVVGAEPSPAAPGPAPAPEPAPRDSFIGTPGQTAPVDAEPLPLAMDPAEYRATAEAVTRGQFGVAQIFLSSAWEPTPAESRQWVDAWSAFLAEIQAPKLGAASSLVVLALTSWAKRRDDPATARAGRSLLEWAAGLFGRRRARADDAPPVVPPAPSQAAPPPPAWTAPQAAAVAPDRGAWGR